MIFFLAPYFCLSVLFVFIVGCAPITHNLLQNGRSTESTPNTATNPALFAFSTQEISDLERLSRLWQKRGRDGMAADYPIGPGDLLEISVPAMEELRSHTVRVSSEGTFFLPLVGKIQAGGLTEEELKEKMRERLEKYMYDPLILTFVKEYRSRQVAVLGAVAKPGLYGLNSAADSILDMISRAGGISPGADPRIYLIPAETVAGDKVREVAATLPESFLSKDPAPLILKKNDPIVIDIKELAFGGHQTYLSLPVRPGDVIMVPGGGQVLVEGWVEKPGAYAITHGLTVSGAVVAAGGPLFPADTSAVKVIRTERGGKKTSMVVDLEKIKRGDDPDIALQGGDIVEVSPTSGKLLAYGLYRFFSTVVSIGVSGNVPLFR
ncbi:MAG: polysaccharide biosynthesis/export family protein [Candidatus Binatia bacterium]